ncbi:hypothetical protein [Sphingobacterium siyangense]|uniref:hypothetical protein n=1 Tax=Sphingobacterium siyangense TaxID=459529 RepID=UPI0019637C98|nr:hypothetical protein [Sphingobacterium siyangense]QRY57029.1 hypothetical protein JVX97_24025 [Sphingobacterium siyangense]
MVKKILQLDFAMAKWFTGKKKNDRVIPGTITFFLFKVMFLDLVVYSLIAKWIGLINDVVMLIIIFLIHASFILFGLEKPLKQMIRSEGLESGYKTMSKSDIYIKRALALSLFISSYIFMFWALVVIFKK